LCKHAVTALKPPNGLPFSCRERAAQNGFKNRTISRAKGSRQHAVLGRVSLAINSAFGTSAHTLDSHKAFNHPKMPAIM